MSPVRQSPSTEERCQSQPAEQHGAAKLQAEPSLAYMHQPACLGGQAAADSSIHVEAATMSQVEGPPDADQQPSVSQQADQGVSSSIDTAALQKEVTELRQQVKLELKSKFCSKQH